MMEDGDMILAKCATSCSPTEFSEEAIEWRVRHRNRPTDSRATSMPVSGQSGTAQQRMGICEVVMDDYVILISNLQAPGGAMCF